MFIAYGCIYNTIYVYIDPKTVIRSPHRREELFTGSSFSMGGVSHIRIPVVGYLRMMTIRSITVVEEADRAVLSLREAMIITYHHPACYCSTVVPIMN